MTIIATVFSDLSAQELTSYSWTLDELAQHVRDSKNYARKDKCPLIKLAKFGDKRTDKNSLRHDANVIEISGVEADYDGGVVSLTDAQTLLFEQNVSAILYTSPSHTEVKPRWRVLCPTSKPYPTRARARFVARLNGALGGIVAPESFALSQSYYVGHVTGTPYEVAQLRGQFIDLLSELDQKAIWPAKKNGENRFERLKDIRSNDAVIAKLVERNLLLRMRTDGGADILCPFESEHTTQRAPAECVYWPAHTGGFTSAHFHCLHGHCANRCDDDFLNAIGVTQEGAGNKRNSKTDTGKQRTFPEIINARDLMAKDFKPVSYLVDNLLPEGAYLLAGRPKIGKSWLSLQIAVDVARGVDCMGRKTEQGDVLYLGLEDNQRRMQSRLKLLAPAIAMPECLEAALWWHRLNDGGIDDLLAWAQRVRRPRLIVVDTIAKVRAAKGRGDDPYATDYAVGEALKKVSDSVPGLSILAVTHIRKAEAEDVLDKISGTLGLSGAFDGAAVLDRKRGDAEGTLQIVGRDLENDIELGVSWESALTRWRIVGDAEEVRISGEQRRILACLRDAKEPMLPSEIADESGLSRGSVRHLIRRLHAAGKVRHIEGKSRQHRYAV